MPVVIWTTGAPVSRKRCASLSVARSPTITPAFSPGPSFRTLSRRKVVLPEPGEDRKFSTSRPRARKKPRLRSARRSFLSRMARRTSMVRRAPPGLPRGPRAPPPRGNGCGSGRPRGYGRGAPPGRAGARAHGRAHGYVHGRGHGRGLFPRAYPDRVLFRRAASAIVTHYSISKEATSISRPARSSPLSR